MNLDILQIPCCYSSNMYGFKYFPHVTSPTEH